MRSVASTGQYSEFVHFESRETSVRLLLLVPTPVSCNERPAPAPVSDLGRSVQFIFLFRSDRGRSVQLMSCQSERSEIPAASIWLREVSSTVHLSLLFFGEVVLTSLTCPAVAYICACSAFSRWRRHCGSMLPRSCRLLSRYSFRNHPFRWNRAQKYLRSLQTWHLPGDLLGGNP